MICPACKQDDSWVTETRLARGRGQPENEAYGIRRRRHCNQCKHRWTTVEINAELLVHLVNVLESVRDLVARVTTIPGKPLLDLASLFEDTRIMRNNSTVSGKPGAYCKACNGPCLCPSVPIDPVTGDHYYGG